MNEVNLNEVRHSVAIDCLHYSQLSVVSKRLSTECGCHIFSFADSIESSRQEESSGEEEIVLEVRFA
jgi:hypothetical protein